MAPTNWGISAPNMAPRNNDCSSPNVGMARSLRLTKIPFGRLRFAQQDGQCRDMRIPLDECRNRSEASQRAGVQCPDRLGYRCAMIINQHALAIRVVLGMSSQVDLSHMARWERVEIGDRITPEVPAAHIDIIDITQQPAVRTPDELTKKLRLRNRRIGKAEVTRRVLNEQTTL